MIDPVPEVSVIMATFNSAEFVEEAITSILKQTFSNIELIIVDGASTDRTHEIVKTQVDRDKRIVFHIQKTNSGAVSARNTAIDLSRGQWIAILDSDDIALPKRLEEQLGYVELNSEIVLLGSGSIEIDANGKPAKKYQYPSLHRELVNNLERLGAFFPHSSCLYRKESLNRIGRFDPRFIAAEDFDVYLRLSEIGQIACLSQPLIKLRRHNTSMSQINNGRPVFVYALAGAVCHRLRLMKKTDPSKLDDDDWLRFVSWLSDRLEQLEYLDRRQFYSELTQLWHLGRQQSLFCKSGSLVRRMFTHPGHLFRIVQERFLGSTLPVKLANEWIQIEGDFSH